jgi:hypothetical protein
MPAGRVSPPWWRYLRFSVRGLLVIVLVSGAGLGWLVRSARIQRDAVAAIERTGGSVEYESERMTGNQPLQHRKQWAPKWLVDALGVDYFRRVVEVGLTDESSDAELAHVGRLPALVKLCLVEMKLTDAGLAHLEGLTNLSQLHLRDTQVSDAGLWHLKTLTNLSRLDLGNTQVTATGMNELKQALPRLEINR